MKFVQWTLVAVGILALLVVGYGLILPSRFAVQRAIEIGAPPEKVYDLVIDTREWKKWTVWNQRDPAMKITYSGPPFGVGAKWSWQSKSEGSGAVEFTHVEPNRLIEYKLTFPDYKVSSVGAIAFEPAGKGTKVTWSTTGDAGPNPIKHYLAALMDHIVGPDFEAGLANLKALAEKP